MTQAKLLHVDAQITEDMLPFTNVIFNADGTNPQQTARVRFANQGPGDAALVYVSLDSRDARRYARDTARAKLICEALNATLTPAPAPSPASNELLEAVEELRDLAAICRNNTESGSADEKDAWAGASKRLFRQANTLEALAKHKGPQS